MSKLSKLNTRMYRLAGTNKFSKFLKNFRKVRSQVVAPGKDNEKEIVKSALIVFDKMKSIRQKMRKEGRS